MTPEEQEKIALTIQENAQKFIDDFTLEGNYDLTETSLVHVEWEIEDQYQFGDPLNTEYNNEFIELVSSYILEVTRLTLGGKYVWNEKESLPMLVVGEPDFEMSFLVHNKVRERMESRFLENIFYHYSIFSDKVKNAKPGDKELI